MTDRELLEAAAKAAGREVVGFAHTGAAILRTEHSDCSVAGSCSGELWNPLAHDADAFRLMVDCGIHVRFFGATICCEKMTGKFLADEVDSTGDQYAATRRAIVRAAAAMGESDAGI